MLSGDDALRWWNLGGIEESWSGWRDWGLDPNTSRFAGYARRTWADGLATSTGLTRTHTGQSERTPVSKDLTVLVTIFCYLGLVGTLYMTGVVWFAQLVHYPLLDRGNAEDYLAFAVAYQRRTLWVVVPGLSCEILGTLGLAWCWPSLQAWVGLGLLLAIWTLTCAILIPRHLLLKQRYSSEDHRALVCYNLPRSLLWTLRAGVMIWTAITLPAGVQ